MQWERNVGLGGVGEDITKGAKNKTKKKKGKKSRGKKQNKRKTDIRCLKIINCIWR